MTPTQSKSKAQRRAEAQRRAAEQRAAELRKKRTRLALRYGGVVAAIALVIVLIVVLTGGSSGVPPVFTNPHVAGLEPIPASMKASWVQPPAGRPGPEVIPFPGGTKLTGLDNAATGQTVDGVQCQAGEKTVAHVHTHLTIFVDGKPKEIPYGIGIPGFQAYQVNPGSPAGPGPFVETGTCFYWLHVHTYDGIIHVESPSKTQGFTLGQFFDEWGQTLNTTQVGPASGKVTVFFSSPGQSPKLYTGDPRDLPLGDHYQIQLVVGTPIVAPVQITNWGGL
jgi:hypothetical protein